MASLTDLAMRILISADDKTGPGVKSAREGIGSISGQLLKLETIAKRVLDFRLFAGWAQDGITLSDTYKTLTGRLNQTVDSTDELSLVQDRLFEAAQSTLTPLEETINLYARSDLALKNLANGQEKAARLTEVVNLSFRAQTSSIAEIQSTVTQLTQSIATQAVQWQDFGKLADTNLLLVNVAAKNLGLDGIGSLKQAMEDGAISNEQLVDAILLGFDEIQAAADQMPITVEAAWTKLNNVMLRYVGESETANTVSTNLANSIQFLANNLNTLVGVVTLLAQIYLFRLAQGLLQTAKGYIENARAAKQSTAAAKIEQAAQQQNLVLKQQMAVVQAKAARQLIEEARLQLALASTEQKRVVANKALAAAMAQYHTAAARSAAINKTLLASSDKASVGLSKMDKGFGLVNNAMNIWLAWEVGQTVGEWLLQFDIVEEAGTHLAQTFTLVVEAFNGLLEGRSLDEHLEKFKKINADYDTIRKRNAESAKKEKQQIEQFEQQKTTAVLDNQKQQVAIVDEGEKKKSKSVKENTEVILSAIDQVAKQFKQWDTNTEEITQNLNKLSNQTLQELKAKAKEAFEAGNISAKEYSQILRDIVKVEVRSTSEKLRELELVSSDAGLQMVKSLKEAAESGKFTQQQLENIAIQLINTAKSAGDLELLSGIMHQAGIETEGTGRAAVALRHRVDELTQAQEAHGTKVKEVSGQYKKMGETGTQAINQITGAQKQLNNEFSLQNQAIQNANEQLQYQNDLAQKQAEILAEQTAAFNNRKSFSEDSSNRRTVASNPLSSEQSSRLSALSDELQKTFEVLLQKRLGNLAKVVAAGGSDSNFNLNEAIDGLLSLLEDRAEFDEKRKTKDRPTTTRSSEKSDTDKTLTSGSSEDGQTRIKRPDKPTSGTSLTDLIKLLNQQRLSQFGEIINIASQPKGFNLDQIISNGLLPVEQFIASNQVAASSNGPVETIRVELVDVENDQQVDLSVSNRNDLDRLIGILEDKAGISL